MTIRFTLPQRRQHRKPVCKEGSVIHLTWLAARSGRLARVASCLRYLSNRGHTRRLLVPPYFRDRADAGRYLAAALSEYADRPDVLILALPRGGVPVAFEVARALHAPLDVFLVRKLGFPGHEEFAMGAIATGGVRILDGEV